FSVEYFDDSVRTEVDVAAATGLPSMALIGRLNGWGIATPRLLDESEMRSKVGEAFRALRTNLYFALRETSAKVVVVTSANPGEGKTTTAVNLALMLACDGRRVIVVDANLRKPAVHEAFDLGHTDSGLSTMLADPPIRATKAGVPENRIGGNAPAEDIGYTGKFVLPTHIPGLSVLPGGPIPPNPSELLGSHRFEEVLKQLRTLADIVVLDSPPVLSVVDPTLIAGRADGVILVAEAGRTRMATMSRAAKALEHGSARILGVVLNKLEERSSDFYIHNLIAGLKREIGKLGLSRRIASVVGDEKVIGPETNRP
ncbi:MAG: CpsD/CapB family tyrosine-protein kinase, partial [Chloroflexota bacterium]